MQGRSLRIAWLGAGPGARESGGVPGVATDLLQGLAQRGHRVDCLFPGRGHSLPQRLHDKPNLTFVWGTAVQRWDRWYSRTRIGAFVSGMLVRALGSLRLRREVARRHRRDPYDVIYQFSNIESLAVPWRLRDRVPLAIHPETHVMGELRFLIAERGLARRAGATRTLAIAAALMAVRSLVQRLRIRRADLLVCISAVFRDHIVADYGFPAAKTVVIPNPVRMERFPERPRALGEPAAVLVLGRVSARKGVEDVLAVAHELLARGVRARVRVVGGPSMWSDYTKLLDELPAANAEYVGRIQPADIPAELARTDVLLQASKYEPFGLTVAEALASGVPVVATSEVGASEGVDRSVMSVLAPGDVAGMADALEATIARLRVDAAGTRSLARAEAQRLFASERVCDLIAAALQALVAGEDGAGARGRSYEASADAQGSPAAGR
ncbi:MAG TPA: glycosyltransferase family 4 protein [Solirubrobacteraceae bacterium]|nr:glycosyltransferase family 4 protein [Solirubrobacteraceae bacterium]